jgi:hypothetical protein
MPRELEKQLRRSILLKKEIIMAHNDREHYYRWALQGDFSRCLLFGDERACSRIYWTHYLGPRFLREIAELLKKIELPPPIVPPGPGPDPSPYLVSDLIPVLLAPHLGDPQPQPSVFANARFEMTVMLRDTLQGFVTELNDEIEGLKNSGPG